MQRLGRIGLWEVRLPEHVYIFSEEMYHILGLDSQRYDATPENYLAAVHPDDRQKVAANIASILQGDPLSSELAHRIIWPDGEVRHVIVRTQMMTCGSATLLFGTLQDITETKRVEAELRKNEERFKYAAQASTDAIWDWDIQSNRSWCSENMQTLFGYACPESDDAVQSWAAQVHPADRKRALNEIDTALKGTANCLKSEYRFLKQSGECIDILSRAVIVRNENGEAVRMVGALVDITERNRAKAARKTDEQKIQHLAFHDSLTGLANRVLLAERVRQALERKQPSGGALLLLDLDDFKSLNDTYGHVTGDQLLKQVAERLKDCVAGSDTVARLGGDEFVILLHHIGEEKQTDTASRARMLGEKVLAAFRLPFIVDEHHSHFMTPSIGIALLSQQDQSADDILRRADMAMYRAKDAGRNTLRFFDPDMEAAIAARVAMEKDMRQALIDDQFMLHYQPQMTCDGEMIGAEALLRWPHSVRGMVPPVKFIPLAEKTGLIVPLGQWVLRTACTRLKRWADMPEFAGLSISVNVSAVQLHSADFVEQVLSALEQTGANPHQLKIELTESIVVDNVEDSIGKMMALKSRGVGFSLDDFGTGYSSLSYLKRLPLDQLKIDQSFVRDIESDPNDAAIVTTIIALGKSLGLKVIAEGVENIEQRRFLDQHGCPAYQGYLLSRPLPAEELETFIKAHQQSAPDASRLQN